MAIPSCAARSWPSARRIRSTSASGTRTPRAFNALQERLEAAHVEDRARDDELGARLDLVLETAELLIEVRSRRIHRHADEKRGRRADRLSADVASVVEARDHVGQPDRVDVE